MEKLNINTLKVSIDNKTILNDISFTLPKGETLIIIGESGSGKTMLSRLLIGIKPDNANINGNIFFDEKDLLKISEKEWNEYRGKKISYISQNPMAVFNPFQNVESHAVELFQSRLGLSKKECTDKMIEEIYDETMDFAIKSKYESWRDNGWVNGLGIPINKWQNNLKNTLPHLKTSKKKPSGLQPNNIPTIKRPKQTYNE